MEVRRMKSRVSLLVLFSAAVGCTLAWCSAPLQAQSFAGKWVHQGPKGVSTLEFFPGDKPPIGALRGRFHHSIVLDDGRLLVGDGHYVLRRSNSHKGVLILHFSDGHSSREREHTFGANELQLEHHGVIRTYIRQP
jgi:hypothetical protein